MHRSPLADLYPEPDQDMAPTPPNDRGGRGQGRGRGRGRGRRGRGSFQPRNGVWQSRGPAAPNFNFGNITTANFGPAANPGMNPPTAQANQAQALPVNSGGGAASARASSTRTSAAAGRGCDQLGVQQPFGLPQAAAGSSAQLGFATPRPAISSTDPWGLRGDFGLGGPADPGATLDFRRRISGMSDAERISLRLALDGEDLRRGLGGAAAGQAAPFVPMGSLRAGTSQFQDRITGAAVRPSEPFSSAGPSGVQPNAAGSVVVRAAESGSSATSRRLDRVAVPRPATPAGSVDAEENRLLNPPDVGMEVEIASYHGDDLSD